MKTKKYREKIGKKSNIGKIVKQHTYKHGYLEEDGEVIILDTGEDYEVTLPLKEFENAINLPIKEQKVKGLYEFIQKMNKKKVIE